MVPRLLVLRFEDDLLLDEDIEGKEGMARYARQTVDAYVGEPTFVGYAIASGSTLEEAWAKARAKFGL